MYDPSLPPGLAGIAKSSPDDLHLHAVRHPLSLDELPLASWIGLPVTGAVELDIDLTVPVVARRHDVLSTHGTFAIRTAERVRIGDDATPLEHPRLAALAPAGIPFTHLDLDALDLELTVAGGRARLTRFDVTSPDLELRLDLSITLAHHVLSSALDGALRFRPTPALTQRDPILAGMLALFDLSRDPSGLATIPFTGTLSRPRRATS